MMLSTACTELYVHLRRGTHIVNDFSSSCMMLSTACTELYVHLRRGTHIVNDFSSSCMMLSTARAELYVHLRRGTHIVNDFSSSCMMLSTACTELYVHLRGNSTVTDVTNRTYGHSNCPASYRNTPRKLSLCMRTGNVHVYLMPQIKVTRKICGLIDKQNYVHDGRYFKKT